MKQIIFVLPKSPTYFEPHYIHNKDPIDCLRHILPLPKLCMAHTNVQTSTTSINHCHHHHNSNDRNVKTTYELSEKSTQNISSRLYLLIHETKTSASFYFIQQNMICFRNMTNTISLSIHFHIF